MNKLFALLPLLLAACSMAPELAVPAVDTPAAFKEDVAAPKPGEKIPEGAWQAEGQEKIVDGQWWKIFQNAELDALIIQATQVNPSLEIAGARLAQARAQAGVAEADLFPTVTAGAGPTIQKTGNAPTQYHYAAQGNIAYELDLFGANRAAANAADFNAESADALYRAALLTLQADVAQAYFALRGLDREQEILETTQKLRIETRDLTQRRLKIGEVSELDVTQAESELAATRAETLAVAQRRAEAEHNLAVLLGKPPAHFNFVRTPLNGLPPSLPPGLPSSLLERRPDIQSAQKKMAEANERIGVARAAFFPQIALTGSGGFASSQLSDLFNWSSRTWLFGPLVGTIATLPIFDAGRNFSNLAASKAGFQESVGLYRQQVLNAFREVENQLSALRFLSGRAAAQQEGVLAARKAFTIAKARYESGYISYLEFIDAQRTLLAAERGEVQVLGDRFVATVQLVRALGGAW